MKSTMRQPPIPPGGIIWKAPRPTRCLFWATCLKSGSAMMPGATTRSAPPCDPPQPVLKPAALACCLAQHASAAGFKTGCGGSHGGADRVVAHGILADPDFKQVAQNKHRVGRGAFQIMPPGGIGGWRIVDFISDLHLSANAPATY